MEQAENDNPNPLLESPSEPDSNSNTDNSHRPTPAPCTRPPRWLIAVEFLILIALWLWGEWAPLNLPVQWGDTPFSIGKIQSSTPVLALVTLGFLWLNGNLREIHFGWPKDWKRYLWHLLLVAVAFMVVQALFRWIAIVLWDSAPEQTDIVKALDSPKLQTFFLLIMPLWAVGEEIYFRAYLIQRFEQLASGWRYATWLAVVLASMIFAYSHIHFGVGRLPNYFISSLLFSAIYLYTKRSLWFVSLIHLGTNVWNLTVATWFLRLLSQGWFGFLNH